METLITFSKHSFVNDNVQDCQYLSTLVAYSSFIGSTFMPFTSVCVLHAALFLGF